MSDKNSSLNISAGFQSTQPVYILLDYCLAQPSLLSVCDHLLAEIVNMSPNLFRQTVEIVDFPTNAEWCRSLIDVNDEDTHLRNALFLNEWPIPLSNPGSSTCKKPSNLRINIAQMYYTMLRFK